MFSQLSDNLDGVFKKIRGQGKISEKNVEDTMREVRLALLDADVEIDVVKLFIERVKKEALGEKVLKSLTPGQQLTKVFHDELTAILGGDQANLDLNPPARILMVGLNGAGKTTSSGKLALRLKKEGRKPLLIACDLMRPAAIEQLATLGDEIDVPVFKPEGETDVVKVAKRALKWAEKQDGSVLIFDTAGRQEVDGLLIDELKKLKEFLDPKEVLLVADSATGQQAVSVAKTFNESVGLSGIILTKLDGDARGGAALSMRHVTQCPIKFAGTGERMEQLDPFIPDRMANRILGMGDVVSLAEKAMEVVEEEEAEKMAKKLKRANFDFDDFLTQLKMLRRMGPLEGILGMLPGVGKAMKNLPIDETEINRVEAIVLSMTPIERSRPEIINGSRRKRIAKGSGVKVVKVNQLLKQFSMMKKMMKKKGKMKHLMSQMGQGGGGGMPFN